MRIPVHENRLDFHGHRGLAALRSVICVLISWSYHCNWALLCTLRLEYT